MFTLHNIITYIIIGLFVYGWYLLFFDHAYLDEEGNVISKKDWKILRQQDIKYH
jgi:hypothetical protein